ncbi:AraC family transcriptional regulator [Flavivirga spongiicola]|uniref:AraC family transcriptional regulator n=1 Tax=Flavivirga spongiicola TaxID=421621 RepID=A0ABU7XWC1_9FLAO|nr:AraC family transcriptional regulator [Flavivirga sp. MEBiC05379]MDO5980080.1 AraC family transcriptional regulator [Flavivirga sp. MEBiC05379]
MGIIEREITPIKVEDFFIVLNNYHAKFDFPVHYHPEFELNFVFNSNGKRIIGDSILEYNNSDLVLVGPNTPHAWMGNNNHDDARVITIQFQQSLFSEETLNRKLMTPIREMIDKSYRGILFSLETQEAISDRIMHLCDKSGFDSFLEFLSILYDLSISRNQTLLSSASFVNKFESSKSKRIKVVSDFIQQNFKRNIKLKEAADLVNMSETAFSHYFKRHTHRSFTEYIHDIRVGNAARLLIESEDSIAEIGYECGFNNLSNFNRIFRKKKGCTPREFKNNQELISKYKV